MPRHARLATLALTLACGGSVLPTVPAAAQEKKVDTEVVTRQKAAVAAALKKADIGKATVVETDNFLVATTLPEARAKTLGAALEKVVPLARKVLQYESADAPWKGKLAVYFLPQSSDFKSFIRSVVMKQPEGVFLDLRSDDPFLVDPVDVPAKATEADQFANTAALIAAAYLKARGGTAAVPDWLADGFGRVTAMRADGTNSKRYQTYRTTARAAVLGPKGGKPPAVTDLWAENRPANPDLLANSLSEYMTYGPGAENLLKLIAGFRPDENGNVPSPNQAFEAAGWKEFPMLEAAWRKWVQTGK